MNSLVVFENAIINEKECLITIKNSLISDLHNFAKYLSNKFDLDIYDFSDNLFILKNDYKFIMFSCIIKEDMMNITISFIPIYNDDVLTDDYNSSSDTDDYFSDE